MKVFISWSGDLSRRVAGELRDWLPNVLQAVEPWMSAEDIDKGARWSSDMASELSQTKAGVLCVTPDNIEAAWLNFEAGALSKTLAKTFVSPFLIGVRPADLKGPLVQFQATEATKTDTRRMITTLNNALGDSALPEKQLDRTYDMWWPQFESALSKIQTTKSSDQPKRDPREILEEILALVRDFAKRSVERGEGFYPIARSDLGAMRQLNDVYLENPGSNRIIMYDAQGGYKLFNVGQPKPGSAISSEDYQTGRQKKTEVEPRSEPMKKKET